MKGIVAVLVVILVCLGVWLLFMQPSEQEVNTSSPSENMPKETLKAVEFDTNNPFAKSPLSDDTQEATIETKQLVSPEQQAKQLAEAEAKLGNLILEYNENLSDPKLRAETQVKIEMLLEEYNALALPIALKKISEN